MSFWKHIDLKVMVLFGVAGPLFGLAAYIGIILAKNPSGIVDAIGGVVFLLLPAYILGGVPALCAGLEFGFVRRNIFNNIYPTYVICALVGGLAGFASTFAFLLVISISLPDKLILAAGMGLLGFCAGCLCGLIAKWREVGSNNSFKPNPLRGSA